jgi:hypothetical protein
MRRSSHLAARGSTPAARVCSARGVKNRLMPRELAVSVLPALACNVTAEAIDLKLGTYVSLGQVT